MRESVGWRRYAGTGVLVLIGLLTLVVPLYDIWTDVFTPPRTTVASTLAENALPATLALVLLVGTAEFVRRDWDGLEVYRVGGWTALTAAIATVLMVLIVGIQVAIQDHLKLHIIAANAVIVAALAGFGIGVNDVKKHRERASLETERDHLAALYEHTTDAIVTFGLAGEDPKVTDTNRSFEALDVGGPRRLLDALRPVDGAALDRTILDYVRAEDRLDVEAMLPGEDGDDAQYFRVRVVPTNNQHTYLLLTDITEQKEREHLLEERRDRLEREKTARETELEERTDQLEFLHSLLRHDVQNGVLVIRSRAEFIAERVEDPLREYAETIASRSTDISDQIDRMRITLDTLTSDSWPREPVPLSILRERVAALHDAYTDVDVAIEGDLPETAVAADEMLTDVLDNLLHNAVEHNDDGEPTVRVGAATDDDPDVPEGRVRITIADDGPGIPAEKHDEVFRRGVSSANEGGDSGSGFGLFFVDSMIDAYGGEVWIEPNDPTGTRFVIELDEADAARSDDD
ncbi:PAS domain-containing sensor histidine kinase [Halarchaeum sp. P4]|uniref:sensor histidine kinase n=1 Tax=Halarchaeum sp. P4 TaxID=3421639 RepID=UPI003EB871BB